MIKLDNKCTDFEISNLIINGGAYSGWPISNVAAASGNNGDKSNVILCWFEVTLEHGRIAFGQSIGLMECLFGNHKALLGKKCSNNLKSAIVSEAISSWLSLFESYTGYDAKVAYFGTSIGASKNNLPILDKALTDRFCLEFDAVLSNGKKEHLAVCGDASIKAIFAKFMSSCIRHSHTPNTSRLDLTLPVFMRIGFTVVAAKDAWCLEVGDVVLLESDVTDCSRSAVDICIGSSHVLSGIYEKNGHVKVAPALEDNKMIDSVTEESNDGVESPYSIKLDFDIGTSEIAYSDLVTLSEGYIFDLGKQLSTGVTVRSGWHVVARGELIDIGEGRLGVRIVECNPLLKTKVDSETESVSDAV